MKCLLRGIFRAQDHSIGEQEYPRNARCHDISIHDVKSKMGDPELTNEPSRPFGARFSCALVGCSSMDHNRPECILHSTRSQDDPLCRIPRSDDDSWP